MSVGICIITVTFLLIQSISSSKCQRISIYIVLSCYKTNYFTLHEIVIMLTSY